MLDVGAHVSAFEELATEEVVLELAALYVDEDITVDEFK